MAGQRGKRGVERLAGAAPRKITSSSYAIRLLFLAREVEESEQKVLRYQAKDA
jgi:hypothetical protein